MSVEPSAKPRDSIGHGLSILPSCILIAMTLLFSACDPFPVRDRIGVSLSIDTRSVVIHRALCPGEKVVSVRLVETDGNVVGDDDDPVLWEIVSQMGSPQSVYTAGSVPAGFGERVPLRGPLPERHLLGALVETSLSKAGHVTFRLPDLSPDVILTGRGKRVDVSSFTKQIREG